MTILKRVAYKIESDISGYFTLEQLKAYIKVLEADGFNNSTYIRISKDSAPMGHKLETYKTEVI